MIDDHILVQVYEPDAAVEPAERSAKRAAPERAEEPLLTSARVTNSNTAAPLTSTRETNSNAVAPLTSARVANSDTAAAPTSARVAVGDTAAPPLAALVADEDIAAPPTSARVANSDTATPELPEQDTSLLSKVATAYGKAGLTPKPSKSFRFAEVFKL